MIRSSFGWLLIFLLAALLLTAGGRIAPQDEETTFRMTANLWQGRLTITNQSITVEPQTYAGFLPHASARDFITTWSGPGRDGQTYPQYTHAQSLLEIPLYLIGSILGGPATTLSAVALTRFFTSLFNSILTALTGWLIALFARRLGLSVRLSLGLSLAYVFGSMALAYTHTNFSEPLLVFLLLGGAYALYSARLDPQRARRWLFIGGCALGLACYTRERSAIMLPAFCLYVFMIRRGDWRSWLIFLIPIGLAGAAIGAWNWLRFGSPLITSYAAWQPETGFGTPIVVGLYGLLLSPGKGLLLYNPIAWLGLSGLATLFRRQFAEALLFSLSLLVPVLFFARYDLWTGGWNWGPRYLLPALPFLILAAGVWLNDKPSRLRRTIMVGLCLIGIVINLPVVLVDHSRYLIAFGERDPDHYLSRSILQFQDSPIVQQWPAVFEVFGLYTKPDSWRAAQRAVDDHLLSYTGPNDVEALSTQLLWIDEFFRLNVPDFWYVHLLLLGFSPLLIGLAVVGLIGLAVGSGWRVMQGLRGAG